MGVVMGKKTFFKQLRRKMRHLNATINERMDAVSRSVRHFFRHLSPVTFRVSVAALVLLAGCIVFAAFRGGFSFLPFLRQHKTDLALHIPEMLTPESMEILGDDMPVDAPYMTGDYHVAVVLGYGYNSEDFVAYMRSLLKSKFGLADMGLIMPFVYPDDFTRGSTARIADLYEKIADGRLRALILAGSPEQTNRVLAKINEDRETALGYTIVSISSQDDVIGTEAVSDIVLDFAHTALTAQADLGESGLPEETEQSGAEYLSEIIVDMAAYFYNIPAPLPPDSELPLHLEKMLGETWSVKPFIDSETGMRSLNHFVIEKNDQSDQSNQSKLGKIGKKKE
ncbi:MAG: hypothetical protein Ta2A_03190 [Treponemataceae bacterium]|nr:MAG: hypothetical protein Ta2A_03190 [Treponemataceae bacterium]